MPIVTAASNSRVQSLRQPRWRVWSTIPAIAPAPAEIQRNLVNVSTLTGGPLLVGLLGDDHFLMKSPICRSLFGMWVFSHKSRNPSNVLICAAESRSDFQRGTRDRNLRII
jgi:hypothetical protein